MSDDVDIWRYETVAGEHVEVHRKIGKGTRPWVKPSGVTGPFLPLDYDVLDKHSPVVITEGERDRDAVIAHADYPATCWKGGAQNWDKTDWNCLAGCKIILWPDRDEIGHESMEALAEHLFDLGCDIWAADIPKSPNGEPDGWGAADCKRGQAQEILDNAYPMDNPYQVDMVDGKRPPIHLCYPPWQPIPGLMEAGNVTIWHGPPKGGKSAMGLLVAKQLLTDRTLVGVDNQVAPKPEQRRDHKIMMIWLEESQQIVDMRKWALAEHHEILDDCWEGNSAWIFELKQPSIADKIKALDYAARQYKPTVIMIDNLARFDPKAESDSAKATEMMTALGKIARTLNASIVIIHHDRKMPGQDGGKTAGDDMSRGTNALTAAVRVMVQIKPEGNDYIIIEGGGTNNTKSVAELRFRKHDVDVNGYGTVALALEEKPDLFEGISNTKAKDMWAHLIECDPSERQHDIRSAGWAGYIMGEFLELDMGQGKKNSECAKDEIMIRDRMKGILGTWSKSGILSVAKETWKDSQQRRERTTKVYIKGKIGWMT